jgi:hypothetical protein
MSSSTSASPIRGASGSATSRRHLRTPLRASASTERRLRRLAEIVGAPTPPTLPSMEALTSGPGWMAVLDGRFVSAPVGFTPSSCAIPARLSNCCSLCGMKVRRGLPMCYHWRAVHAVELCAHGYVARSGFATPSDALTWLHGLLTPLGHRLSARGGYVQSRTPKYAESLHCAVAMNGTREVEAARASLKLVAAGTSARASASAAASSAAAFSTDVAASLLLSRTEGGMSAALSTRTEPPCDASARIFEMPAASGSPQPLFCAEAFLLHSHAPRPHHAVFPRRPGQLLSCRSCSAYTRALTLAPVHPCFICAQCQCSRRACRAANACPCRH